MTLFPMFKQTIRQVSCGAVHVVVLSEDGLLQAWGTLISYFLKFSFVVVLSVDLSIQDGKSHA